MSVREFPKIVIRGDHEVSFSVSEDEHGYPWLVKIKTSLGDTEQALLNACMDAVSVGPQNDVSLRAYVDEFVGREFEPSGLVYWHDDIVSAKSVLDYVFRVLGVEYCHRRERGRPRKPRRPVVRIKTLFEPRTPAEKGLAGRR